MGRVDSVISGQSVSGPGHDGIGHVGSACPPGSGHIDPCLQGPQGAKVLS